MVQRRQDLCFTLETREPFIVVGKLIRKDFDGDVPAELSVARAIDLTHAALANELEDFVVGEWVTGFERHDRAMRLRRSKVGNRGIVEKSRACLFQRATR